MNYFEYWNILSSTRKRKVDQSNGNQGCMKCGKFKNGYFWMSPWDGRIQTKPEGDGAFTMHMSDWRDFQAERATRTGGLM